MSERTASPTSQSFLTNRRLSGLFLVTVVVAIVAFFVADNFVMVQVRILTFDFQMRLAWVMLACLLIGALCGALAVWWLRRPRR